MGSPARQRRAPPGPAARLTLIRRRRLIAVMPISCAGGPQVSAALVPHEDETTWARIPWRAISFAPAASSAAIQSVSE